MNRRAILAAGILSAAMAFGQGMVNLGNNIRATPASPRGTAALQFDFNTAEVSRGPADMQIQLPGGPNGLLRRKSFTDRGNGNGLWLGSVNLRGDSDVALTILNGFLAGTIQVGTDFYEIRPTASGHVIEKLDLGKFPPGAPPVAPPSADANTGTAPVAEPSAAAAGDPVVIDLMSVYTPQARAAAGGTAQIQALIQSAVDNANLAFSNSLVNATYSLVNTTEVAHNDAGDLGTDLSWVSADATVAALRNQYGADMVSLIVENGAGYCGMGYVQRSVGAGFASSAFQVTARTCAVGNLSFAHEHGHNLGMEHDPTNGPAPSSASYPWSFGHYVSGVYRTVMSYPSPCGCSRVAYFSNPSVIYSGNPTGLADQRDNARTANATVTIVAAFRPKAATTPPNPPSGLTANPAGSAQINLAWTDGSSDETGFQIERSTDGGVNFTLVATTGASATSYSNTGLPPSTTFHYRVRAVNGGGNSSYTNVAFATTATPAPPSAPQSLVATAFSSSQINLAWTDTASNETGFKIERSTDGVNFAQIATTGANTVTFSNTGLAASTNYSYRVRATNADGDSNYSNTSSATTLAPPAAPPATPTNFTGAPGYNGAGKNKTLARITLNWTDVANNTSYTLERCKVSGKGNTATCSFAPFGAALTADSSSYVDTGVEALGKGTYRYRLNAANASGPSAWAQISVTAN